MDHKECCMNEYVGAVMRFADDLHAIGVSIAERERGMDLYLKALLAPSTAKWRSFYRFVFELLSVRRRLAAAGDSTAIGRLVALVEDDFGAQLFGANQANALPSLPANHRFYEASVPS
jgi:hypothetical protein